MLEQIRVAVVGPHRQLYSALISAIDGTAGIKIVGFESDALGAIDMIYNSTPDIIIYDMSTPGMGFTEISKTIKHYVPDSKLIAISEFHHELRIVEAYRACAHGYLTTEINITKLAKTICKLHNDQKSVEHETTSQHTENLAT